MTLEPLNMSVNYIINSVRVRFESSETGLSGLVIPADEATAAGNMADDWLMMSQQSAVVVKNADKINKPLACVQYVIIIQTKLDCSQLLVNTVKYFSIWICP